MIPEVLTLTPSQALWPRQLDERLESVAPSSLWIIGNQGLLAERKVGLFCSVRCPDDTALRAYDACRKLRDEGMTLISGFHSPVEKECLKILLQGTQPIIVCSGAVAAKNADSGRMEAGTGRQSPPHSCRASSNLRAAPTPVPPAGETN